MYQRFVERRAEETLLDTPAVLIVGRVGRSPAARMACAILGGTSAVAPLREAPATAIHVRDIRGGDRDKSGFFSGALQLVLQHGVFVGGVSDDAAIVDP